MNSESEETQEKQGNFKTSVPLYYDMVANGRWKLKQWWHQDNKYIYAILVDLEAEQMLLYVELKGCMAQIASWKNPERKNIPGVLTKAEVARLSWFAPSLRRGLMVSWYTRYIVNFPHVIRMVLNFIFGWVSLLIALLVVVTSKPEDFSYLRVFVSLVLLILGIVCFYRFRYEDEALRRAIIDMDVK